MIKKIFIIKIVIILVDFSPMRQYLVADLFTVMIQQEVMMKLRTTIYVEKITDMSSLRDAKAIHIGSRITKTSAE